MLEQKDEKTNDFMLCIKIFRSMMWRTGYGKGYGTGRLGHGIKDMAYNTLAKDNHDVIMTMTILHLGTEVMVRGCANITS